MKISEAVNKKHLLLMFLILTFVISWGGILRVIGMDGLLSARKISADALPCVYLATFLVLSTACLLLTGLFEGKSGFRGLLARLTRWRMDARLDAGVILDVPLLMAAFIFSVPHIPVASCRWRGFGCHW